MGKTARDEEKIENGMDVRTGDPNPSKNNHKQDADKNLKESESIQITDSEIQEEADASQENIESVDTEIPAREEAHQEKTEFEEKIRELEEQNLRIRAEFANYKRRIERDQVEFAKYLRGEILKNLLPVLDDFKIMIDKSSDKENEQSVLEGAKMIYEKFSQILEKEGLEKIDALGERFDPEIHEALMMKQIENEEEHDKIVEVYQDGFKLKDKLLRPSKVVVGKYENDKA